EIYNYRELRADLLRRGHTLASEGDTETLVHLYEEYGDAFLAKLRGMFAIAIRDDRRRRLLVARDRLGIKPLYWTRLGRGLAFASELKSLLELPGVAREIDLESLDHYFRFLTTPRAHSIVKGVQKLEPGNVLVAEDGREPVVSRWWDVKFEPVVRAPQEEREMLRALLDDSVRAHMVSDVPVGAFLSGGVDSSTVVALMARHVSGPLETFSIGFDEREFDERGFARQVASRFGTRHFEAVLEPGEVADLLPEMAWHLDEPFGDSSAIPTWLVSRLAASHLKVVLSGDGGDELFAGYDRYRVEGRERRFDRVPALLRRAAGAVARAMPVGMRGRERLRHHALAGRERYLDACSIFRTEELRRLLTHEARAQLEAPELEGSAHWLSRLQNFDLHGYLPLDILTKVDRMSMAHSLEARVPFLDHTVVEFAATIPADSHLYEDGRTKRVLKEAVRGLIPDEVIDRPKRGFAVPLGRWLRGPLADLAGDLLLSGRLQSRGLLDPREVERIYRRPSRGADSDLDLKLWTLLSLELWCRSYLDGDRRRIPAPVPARQRA
ncbi:MAG TPA: asparagine synthase (glutamine-hydrolyzing), partial [bacterium]|nr:asparagine synthase (glutamine-hydrolyzing) [bacterium]